MRRKIVGVVVCGMALVCANTIHAGCHCTHVDSQTVCEGGVYGHYVGAPTCAATEDTVRCFTTEYFIYVPMVCPNEPPGGFDMLDCGTDDGVQDCPDPLEHSA